jgi:hypothetical protein
MTAPVYATLTQYRDETRDTASSDAKVTDMLPRASLRLDEMLIGVVYTTDVMGAPTDAATAEVFKRATCAQAEFMIDQDDKTGAKRAYTNVSVGGVSYTRAQDSTGPAADRFAPEAVSILHTEGILPANIATYGLPIWR